MDDDERRRWVGGYFWAEGGEDRWETVEEVVLNEGRRGWLGVMGEDPIFVVRGKKKG